MSEAPTTVSVKILDKEYQVACPEDEVEALTTAARFLDEQMQQIRDSGKVFGLDRIAVMAALNIANEFLSNRSSATSAQSEIDGRIDALSRKIASTLGEHRQLKL